LASVWWFSSFVILSIHFIFIIFLKHLFILSCNLYIFLREKNTWCMNLLLTRCQYWHGVSYVPLWQK
jgi:hypothetical protein